MMTKLKDKLNSLNPDMKRKVIIGLICLAVVMLLLLGYQIRSSTKTDTRVVAPKETKRLTTDLSKNDEDYALRSSMNYELGEATKRNQEIIERQDEEIFALKEMVAELLEQSINQSSIPIDNGSDSYLKSTPESRYTTPLSPYQRQDDVKEKLPPIVISGKISHVKSQTTRTEQIRNDNATRKELINYIPSGTIIKATLLNGMYAPTMSKGSSQPYPALMRLIDLSFLPNEVRKDLSGCFLMGEAAGELSDSRVHVRLSSLSCISSDEKRVLDKKITGYVNGGDGKVGIYGEILANFGKIALAALLAEFLAAAGEAIESSTQVVTTTALGGITTSSETSALDLALAAGGSGIGEASSMIAEFYLDIMTEMSPVIEISGRQDVEVVIDTGVELTMDDYRWIGVKTNEEDDKAIFNID